MNPGQVVCMLTVDSQPCFSNEIGFDAIIETITVISSRILCSSSVNCQYVFLCRKFCQLSSGMEPAWRRIAGTTKGSTFPTIYLLKGR